MEVSSRTVAACLCRCRRSSSFGLGLFSGCVHYNGFFPLCERYQSALSRKKQDYALY